MLDSPLVLTYRRKYSQPASLVFNVNAYVLLEQISRSDFFQLQVTNPENREEGGTMEFNLTSHASLGVRLETWDTYEEIKFGTDVSNQRVGIEINEFLGKRAYI